mgnify:FL=1|tara:strand:+ start:585 stop:884 length:300 start_codon:yes stop_codon:yes gene_type:complete
MKLPWSSSQNQSEEKQTSETTQTMPESKNTEPVLSFEGKKYDLKALPDELKELLRRLQVAEQQLRMHDDTLKVLAVGRQTIAAQIKEKLAGISPLPDEK